MTSLVVGQYIPCNNYGCSSGSAFCNEFKLDINGDQGNPLTITVKNGDSINQE